MNILTLGSLNAKTEIVIVAFLWDSFSIVCLLLQIICLILFNAFVLLHHLLLLLNRILILHGLVHKIELHLMMIIGIVVAIIEMRMRALPHYLLSQIKLEHLLIYHLLHLKLLLSQRRLLLLSLDLILLLCNLVHVCGKWLL